MCHGHPRCHPCAHTSINWYYCPTAFIDLDTGYETPCGNVSFAPAQATKLGCPLQHCDFKDKAGSWLCCACKQGPNTQGWCTMPRNRLRRDRGTFLVEDVMTTCDHGCCKECIKFGSIRMSDHERSLRDIRRETAARRKLGYSQAAKPFCRGPSLSSTPPSMLNVMVPQELQDVHESRAGSSSPKTTPSSLSASSTITPSSLIGSGPTATYRLGLDYRTKRPKLNNTGHRAKAH